MKKNNKKGFTLAELLIVVAIIAVLTAIAIPVFTTQLEKSREATDIANVRSAYAFVMSNYLSGETEASKLTSTVSAKQTVAGWQGDQGSVATQINGVESAITFAAHTTGSSYTISLTRNDETGIPTISIT